MSGIEEEKSVTTVGISPWAYCVYVCIGLCGYVSAVVLGILLRGAICLRRVDKMVVNAAGLGIA